MTAGDLTTYEGWCAAQETATVEVDDHAVEQAYLDRGAGEPVVFLHGIPTWGFLWRGIAPRLADGYRVIVPDLVGFGASDFAEGFDRSIRAQEQALDSLLNELGVDECHLVAHDIGGGVALRFAAHRPERVRKLVCSNVVCYDSWPVEFITELGLPATESMSGDELEATLDFAFADGAYGDADPDFVAGMKYPWLEREAGKRALARAAVSTNTNHTTEIPYDAIDAELLCLWAENDVMQPIDYGRRLVEVIGGEVVVLDESFHWVPEDRTEAYRAELRAFLDQ